MLYKRGSVWWIKIQWQGRIIRRSTKTSNKKIADTIEVKIRHELATGVWFQRSEGDSRLFKDVWAKYLVEDAQDKAPATVSRAKQCEKHLIPFFGEMTLNQITPADLSAYRAMRRAAGVKTATAIKELQFVRRVFTLCKRNWKYIRQSPFEDFEMPADDTRRVRFLEPGQFDRLVEACPAWLQPIVLLARYTGMRKGNVLGLTWNQVDLENRVINLDRTKNGDRLSLPLTETAYLTLVERKQVNRKNLDCPFVFHRDGMPYSPNQVSMSFRRACKRARIPDFRFHDLRHDFASTLVRNGTDLYRVQHLLGHKDSRMTQRYAHLQVEDLRKAVEALETGHKKGHSGEKEEELQPVAP
jgi:integrase